MNSASVDLIYLDPPFNSKANYAAPIGSQAAGAEFKDTWGLDDVNLAWHGEIKHEYPGLYSLLTTTREVHGDSMMSYLIYMAARIMEMRRLLKESGSIYLHCDPTASHYLKLLMDSVFGPNAIRNEIIWQRSTASGGKAGGHKFVPAHDTVLFYAVSGDFQYNRQYIPYEQAYIDQRFKHVAENGRRYRLQLGDRRQYLDESKGKPVSDIWVDIHPINPMAKEKTGYPTQKPLALLRRIILASSNEDDVILDPFCGCATACIAAELEHRQWVGIDISDKAADLVQDRMNREVGMFFTGAHRTDVPERTDLGKVIPYNAAANKRYLYGEQGGYCNGCQTHFEARHFHVDHIIPRAKGGTDHISNLQLLCGHCNSVKGAKTHEHLLACLTDKGWIKRRKAA